MSDYLAVFGLALLPALGNFGGGLLAEYLPTSTRNLNRALHAAAGIVIAIVAVELIPRALQVTSGWVIALAFGGGGLACIGLQALVERLQNKRSDDDRTSMWNGGWSIAVAVDLFSDGLMIGAGSAVAASLALILALGQVLADVPEGFATMANFKDKQAPRTRRLILGASFAVPVLLAATLAYMVLRSQGEAPKMAALVFTAGLLTVAAVEDMIVEAHEVAKDTAPRCLRSSAASSCSHWSPPASEVGEGRRGGGTGRAAR